MSKLNAFFDKNATKITEKDVDQLRNMMSNAQTKAKEDAYKVRTDFNEGLKYTSLPSLGEVAKKNRATSNAMNMLNNGASIDLNMNKPSYNDRFANTMPMNNITAETTMRNNAINNDINTIRQGKYDAQDVQLVADKYGLPYDAIKSRVADVEAKEKEAKKDATWKKISDEDKMMIDDAINRTDYLSGNNRNRVFDKVLNDNMKVLKDKYNLTDDEVKDFELSYKYYRRNAVQAERDEKARDFANEHPVLGTASSFGNTAVQPLEGVANTLAGLVTDDERWLDHEQLKRKNAKREGAKENLNTVFGQTAYDLGTGLGDMGVASLEAGALGLHPATLMAMNTADRAQYEALQNGSDTRKASAYGTVAGLADYAFNKVGLDKIKESINVDTIKTGTDLLRNMGGGFLAEGGENVLQDIVESVADNLINGEKSNLQVAYADYIDNGATPSQAFAQTALDYAKQLGMSGVTGGLFGATFAGAKGVPELLTNQIGDRINTNFNNSFTANDVNDVNAVPRTNNVQDTTYVEPNKPYKINNDTFIGNGTKIDNPYTGSDKLPIQTKQNTNRYEIADSALENARRSIDIANKAVVNGGKFTSTIKKIYESLFDNYSDNYFDSRIENLNIDGEPYDVRVHKGVVSKVLGNKVNETKIAVLEDLDNIIKTANYVGSGDYVAKNKNQRISRYDYFEKPISVGGKEYTVTFSVAIDPTENRYRTHAIIDELKIQQLKAAKSGTQIASQPVAATVGFDNKIAPSETNVNTNKVMAEDTGIGNTTTEPDEVMYEERLPQTNELPDTTDNLLPNRVTTNADGSETLTSNEYVESKTSSSIREGKTRFDENIRKELDENPIYHEKLSNKDIEQVSSDIMTQGTEYARNMYNELVRRRNAIAVPLASKLANQMVAEGNKNGAMDVLRTLAEANTQSGQFVQANMINMLRNDPVSILDYVQSDLDSINKKGAEKFGKKWRDFKLTDSEVKAFEDMARNGEVDAEKVKAILDGIGKRLEADYPVTLKEAFVEAGHVGMLLNMSTMERNVLANVFMLPQRALAQRYTAIGQDAYNLMGKLTGKKVDKNEYAGLSIASKKLARQKWNEVKDDMDGIQKYFDDRLAKDYGANSLKNSISQRAYFKLHHNNALSKAWDSGKELVGLDSNKNIIAGVADAVGNKVPVLNKANQLPKKALNLAGKVITGSEGKFDNLSAEKSIMENVRQFTYALLDVGDEPFVKINFINRLASYMDAKGIKDFNDIPDEAVEIAKAEALKATFKDDNAFTETFGKLAKIPVVGEVAIPFKKTTANLAARAYDYSLANILYNAYQYKNGEVDMNKLLSAIGEGASGTTMAALGALLYKNGIITGKPSEDTDQKKFDEANGFKPYAFSSKGLADYLNKHLGTNFDFGNTYKTWDWAQPWSTNFSTGIATLDALNGDDGRSLYDIGTDVIAAYGDGILESDLMSNIKEMLGAGDFSDESTTMNVINSLVEFPTRYVPSQVKAYAKYKDNVKRETYVADDKPATVLNTIKSGIPMLRETLPKSYNIYGDEIKLSGDSKAERARANFFSAGKTGVNQSKWYSEDIQKLYDDTMDEEVFPQVTVRNMKYKNEDGNQLNKQLSPQEYSELSKKQGELNDELSEAFFNSDFYNENEADMSANAYKKLLNFSREMAKAETFDYVTLSNDNQKLKDIYYESGAQGVVDYLAEKVRTEKRSSDLDARGLGNTDFVKEAYDSGDEKTLAKMEKAQKIASEEYGIDSITEKQWKTYDKKSEKAFKKELEYSSAAKKYETTDNEYFRDAYDHGERAVKEYIKKRDAITSIENGVDEFGDTKYLSYSEKLADIYDDKGIKGVETYNTLKNNSLNQNGNVEADKAYKQVKRLKANDSDKGYYLAQLCSPSKDSRAGKMVEKGNYNDYYQYVLIKHEADADLNGSIAIEKELVPYLKKQNMSNTKRNEIVKWYQDKRSKKVYF